MKTITRARLEELLKIYSDKGMHRINGGSGMAELSTGERVVLASEWEIALLKEMPVCGSKKGALLKQVRKELGFTYVLKARNGKYLKYGVGQYWSACDKNEALHLSFAQACSIGRYYGFEIEED